MEPTEEMIEKAHEAYYPSHEYGLDDEDMGLAYKAMVEACKED